MRRRHARLQQGCREAGRLDDDVQARRRRRRLSPRKRGHEIKPRIQHALRQQVTQVRISATINTDDQRFVVTRRQQTAEQWLQTLVERGLIETNRQVEIVAIGQCERVNALLERALNERFG